MKITVKLINQRNRPAKGVVQVGTQALETVDGAATFNIEENGSYTVRGLAMHCHFETKVVELVGSDLDITLESR